MTWVPTHVHGAACKPLMMFTAQSYMSLSACVWCACLMCALERASQRLALHSEAVRQVHDSVKVLILGNSPQNKWWGQGWVGLAHFDGEQAV